MQKYEETHQFVISRKRERKKKNAAISGAKVQLNDRAEMKQLVDSFMQFWACTVQIMRSRHQDN